MQDKRILLIGGHGFVGCNLARYLAEKKYELSILHRPGADLDNLAGLSYQTIEVDLADSDHLRGSVESALFDCCGIFNLATFTTGGNESEGLDLINVKVAKMVAQIARQKGIRLVHLSSSTAIGFPHDNIVADEGFIFNGHGDKYAYSKHRGEQEILEEAGHGGDIVIAVPCSTVGALGMKSGQLSLFKKIAQGKIQICPPGGLCLTSINDLVTGLHLCFEKGQSGERYILGGVNITYRQYLAEVSRCTGNKGKIIHLSKLLVNTVGMAGEILKKITGRQFFVDRKTARMICANLYYSSEKSCEELGYTIKDWRQTIRETVHEMRSRNVF